MDPQRFDRFTRALTTAASRRGILAALVAGLFPALLDVADAVGKRRRHKHKDRDRARRHDRPRAGQGRSHRVTAEKKKKSKKKKCKPKCTGKQCGPNGCKNGSCGTCLSPTRCNAHGQCVGCLQDNDCPPLDCKSRHCNDGTCEYSDVADGTSCPTGSCCGGDCCSQRCTAAGQCVECVEATDCLVPICQQAACVDNACELSDGPDGATCLNGGLCCGGECLQSRECCTNAQCSDPNRPHCSAAGQCFACLNASHCPAQDCLTPVCFGGDCAFAPGQDGVVCGPNGSGICCSSTCHLGEECCDDNQCQTVSGHICLDGQCVECQVAEDCALPGPCETRACQNNDCVYSPRGDNEACAGPPGSVCCGGICTAVQFDPQACGTACGAAPCGDRSDACSLGVCKCGVGPICPADATCQEGACVCTDSGEQVCGDLCTDTQSDPDHCGSCGHVCATTEGCHGGQCCTVCASGCPFATLAAAAASAASGDTITVCPGTYVGPLAFIQDKTLTIVGLGDDPTETVLTANDCPQLNANNGSDITVRNLTVTGCNTGTIGAVVNVGTLTLDRVHVTNNSLSSPSFGGGIDNSISRPLTLIDCLIKGNQAVNGAGIRNQGALTLIRTIVEGNQGLVGGGIYMFGGRVDLTDNSHVRNNTAAATEAGGIRNENGIVSIDATSSITGNNPLGSDCVDVGTGTGCP